MLLKFKLCLPGGTGGKESACKAEDPGSVPESGRFPGEGLGYPLQYSWAPMVAKMVKNPPAMQKTEALSLGWENPLKEAWQPTPVFLPGKSPWTEEPGGLQSMGSQRVGHDLATKQHHYIIIFSYITNGQKNILGFIHQITHSVTH